MREIGFNLVANQQLTPTTTRGDGKEKENKEVSTQTSKS